MAALSRHGEVVLHAARLLRVLEPFVEADMCSLYTLARRKLKFAVWGGGVREADEAEKLGISCRSGVASICGETTYRKL